LSSRNKYDKLGWFPVDEINGWIRRVSKNNGLTISDVLNRMAREYIANHDPKYYQTHLAPKSSTVTKMTYE